jgi:hypothetical protein
MRLRASAPALIAAMDWTVSQRVDEVKPETVGPAEEGHKEVNLLGMREALFDDP